MLIEFIASILFGILCGVVTGLLPGLHVNTITFMALVSFPLLDPLKFAVFITAMATTHTFLDFIPSIFLGAPEESTALSVLPAHKMLLQGRGVEAVKITGIASLYGVFMSCFLLIPAFFLVPVIYGAIREVVAPLLIVSAALLILRERDVNSVLWASFVFFVSGYFGFVVLNKVDALSTTEIFFPLFSGLFGLSTLITGILEGSENYPQENDPHILLPQKSLSLYSFLGSLGGLLVGLLPAMSPSQIGIAFQEMIGFSERSKKKPDKIKSREFITILGSLNTADSVFSVFALYLIGNPRSGVSVTIQRLFGAIDLNLMLVFVVTMVVSGMISYFLHLYIGSKFATLSGLIDFRKLSAMAFIFVLSLVVVLTGFVGFLIAITGLLIGLIPVHAGVSRTHCMGVLILPTILFFL